jgi:solute carrier family 8 (sodium/calcium exchanger)
VFLTTAAWSVFAYLWLFIVLVVISPNVVDLWEAVITLLSFPVLVLHSYMAEKNFFMKVKAENEDEGQNLSEMS